MLGAPPCRARENVTTVTAPTLAAAQKATGCRCPLITLAMTAVHMGSTPITTAECPVPVVCNASAVSSGKPKQDPPATIISAGQSRRCGFFTRKMSSAPMESAAAITPRKPVVVHGPKLSIAQTVPGKLKEKARTPRLASKKPERSISGAW